MDLLLNHGALDVFTSAITMKKSRLGILITVICASDRLDQFAEILFRETTTLGIRRRLQERTIIPRQIIRVATQLGTARVKVAQRGHRQTFHPEYDDCVKLAQQHQLPLEQVQEIILKAAIALEGFSES
jgi:pyridinium-3,5-bisthiocarboxylic acid mononucleotide nickel chelatase